MDKFDDATEVSAVGAFFVQKKLLELSTQTTLRDLEAIPGN